MRIFAAVKALAGAAAAVMCVACAAARPGIEAPPQPQVQYLDVGVPGAPLRLAYQDTGSGRPLLLLHGFGASTYTWRRLVPLLDDHYRVIAVDMKGFGQSDKPLDERYSLRDQAEVIATFIRRMDLKRLTLIGHSFGGGVALLLALDQRPDLKGRIERLVILDGLAYRQNIPVFFRLLSRPGVAAFGMALVPPEIQAQAALRIAYEDNSLATAQNAAAYAKPLHSEGGRHALISTAQQIVPPDLDEIAAKYSTITLPALLLWCERDKIVPLEIGWRLHAALPNATFHMLQGCGHMPQEEVPEVTADRIRDFLGRR